MVFILQKIPLNDRYNRDLEPILIQYMYEFEYDLTLFNF